MSQLATTKMSSKGQVVIPEKIRKQLNLAAGSQFIVIAEDDVVILKRITPPDIEAYRDLIEQAREQADQQKESGKADTTWPEHFFEDTYGVQAADPIERPPQGDYPERETLQ